MPGCSICSDLREWSVRELAGHMADHDEMADRVIASVSSAARADLRVAFRAWTRTLTWESKAGDRSAYLANGGTYRLRKVDRASGGGGSVLGPVTTDAGPAPWSRLVLRLFPNNGAFHRAAERWRAQQDARQPAAKKRRRPSNKRPARKGRNSARRGGERRAA